METISSTWSSEQSCRLLGCGVDLETVDRFQDLSEASDSEASDFPMPFVFTKGEITHARQQAEAARALCVCFSCKEAVRKAVGVPYNYTECEAFPVFQKESLAFEGTLLFSDDFRKSTGICEGYLRSAPLNAEALEQWTAVLLYANGAF